MALARIHFPHPLSLGCEIDLPAAASRHIQVLRMQPGESVCLFPGGETHTNCEWQAEILAMGRQIVRVRITDVQTHNREIETRVHLVVAMPTNERMDWLVEKVTELGVYSISPVMTERSVLRLKGERADKKREHWQAIAAAACEQSGRNTLPLVHPVRTLTDFLKAKAYQTLIPANAQPSSLPALQCVLSLSSGTQALRNRLQGAVGTRDVCFASGPEGGLAQAEEQALMEHGFAPTTLGRRVLRAETAPLAALAHIALSES
ncbi:16S rRNA (uracil(1498)-N(3))-methyltransferase [Lampropedia aestuarii]|uniref:16S rRNA (uracil(1498)-N(3))-methyltransferase n=1 Tax=Lampropedia aestuarii TaxID=2562762 RepID=UPI00246839CD|nr:16S rRNA (uracil(1498)-N(3))-methyltransferase [Lampropedia aestuarii]MDH5855841.1 16S rRNA (uracil(1498)-N(3))-methyltransferase [Lampropedia aestuarii]